MSNELYRIVSTAVPMAQPDTNRPHPSSGAPVTVGASDAAGLFERTASSRRAIAARPFPRTVVIATPNIPTLTRLTATFANEVKWRLRVAHSPRGLSACIDTEDVRLAIVDERWLNEGLLDLLRKRGPSDTGTLFAPILSGASELEAYSWLKRGASAFVHEPMSETPQETLEAVLKSALRALTLPRDALARVEVRASTRPWIEFRAPSCSSVLEQFQRFFAMLHATSLTAEERRMLHLAINEIGMNAIEWGNRQDATRQFCVAYAFYPNKVLIRIEDEGAGFDPRHIPDPTKNPAAVLALRQAEGKRLGGYGLALARNIMDTVEYNARGTICYMEKALRPSESRRRHGRTISAKLADDDGAN